MYVFLVNQDTFCNSGEVVYFFVEVLYYVRVLIILSYFPLHFHLFIQSSLNQNTCTHSCAHVTLLIAMFFKRNSTYVRDCTFFLIRMFNRSSSAVSFHYPKHMYGACSARALEDNYYVYVPAQHMV